MSDKQQFVVICILLAGFCCALGFECTPAEGYEGCACYTEKNVSFGNTTGNSTKEYVNLLPLKVNSSTPRFTDMDKDGFYISYTPCGDFSEFVGENKTGSKPCVKASVARWTNLSIDSCENLGNGTDATFESSVIGGYIKSNLTLKFRSPENKHSAIISLVCNDTLAENESFFEYVGTMNMPTDTYYLALTSKCCCPGKCGSPPPVPITTKPASSSTTSKPGNKSGSSSSSSLKTWEIIVIVAACVIFVLIIVGIVCCFCKKKPGYETV